MSRIVPSSLSRSVLLVVSCPQDPAEGMCSPTCVVTTRSGVTLVVELLVIVHCRRQTSSPNCLLLCLDWWKQCACMDFHFGGGKL